METGVCTETTKAMALGDWHDNHVCDLADDHSGDHHCPECGYFWWVRS